MNKKEFRFDDKAREAILAGVNKTADAVVATLGAKGRNVLIETDLGLPHITKDGVTVAREINLSDKFENLGAQMIKSVAIKQNEVSGDGTTTATALARAIYREGSKLVAAGISPTELKTGIDLAVVDVVKELKVLSREVEGIMQISQVGTLSANGDLGIGDTLAKALTRVGKHGVITIEESKLPGIYLEVVDGVKIDSGYASPYFCTNVQKLVIEYQKPAILLYNGTVNTIQEILPWLENVVQTKRPLLIIANGFSGDAFNLLVTNKLKMNLPVAAVITPGFGDRKLNILEDIAATVGAHVVNPSVGESILEVAKGDVEAVLGKIDKVFIDRYSTTLIGIAENPELNLRKTQLEEAITNKDTADYERDMYKERLARLNSAVAVVKIGATTEAELRERRDRLDDALHATRAAVEEGVVAGGGTALLRLTRAVDASKAQNEGIAAGMRLLRSVLSEPIRIICENAGVNGSSIADKVFDKFDNTVYDVRNMVFIDAFEAGILDPTKVVRTALEDAASVAGLLLTTQVLIANAKEDTTPDITTRGGF